VATGVATIVDQYGPIGSSGGLKPGFDNALATRRQAAVVIVALDAGASGEDRAFYEGGADDRRARMPRQCRRRRAESDACCRHGGHRPGSGSAVTAMLAADGIFDPVHPGRISLCWLMFPLWLPPSRGCPRARGRVGAL